MNFTSYDRKDGTTVYQAIDRYVDPLTGKRKKATVTFMSNTPRGRRQAERDFEDKIDDLINQRQDMYDESRLKTFGELRDAWLEQWAPTVASDTFEREKVVLKRVAELIDDDVLIEKMTPLLIEKFLADCRKKYNLSITTMRYIKSVLSKIFDFAVL